MAVTTAEELAALCRRVATQYRTLYVMGCFGAPMTDRNKQRYTANHAYNREPARTAMIQGASTDTFGFDCVCLIKGILWGWNGDVSHVYGGAVYQSNGVPDISDSGMIGACRDVSTDFSRIDVGEVVWMPGHIGVYIGDGLAVESTPAWSNGVQITACNCERTGHPRRDWVKHGKLPYVTYTPEASKQPEGVALPLLQKGSKGTPVVAMQLLLTGFGYSCGKWGADGDFGEDTKTALLRFQTANGLETDGICGCKTWGKLLGV